MRLVELFPLFMAFLTAVTNLAAALVQFQSTKTAAQTAKKRANRRRRQRANRRRNRR